MLAPKYISSDTTIARIEEGKIISVAMGTVDISAFQPGNGLFSATDTLTKKLVIEKGNQEIIFNTLPNMSIIEQDLILSAKSSSGLPVEYTSSEPKVAIVSEGKVEILHTGKTVITALQEGDSNYLAAAPVQQTLNVLDKEDRIDFNILGHVSISEYKLKLIAKSKAGVPIVFTSSDESVVEIVDNKGIIKSIGTVVITASSMGNKKYSGAFVTQKISISPLNTKAVNHAADLDEKIRIYPNPIDEFVTIEIDKLKFPSGYSLKLYSVFNVFVKQWDDQTESVIKLDTYDIPKGMYYLHIQSPEYSIIKRVVK